MRMAVPLPRCRFLGKRDFNLLCSLGRVWCSFSCLHIGGW